MLQKKKKDRLQESKQGDGLFLASREGLLYQFTNNNANQKADYAK